MSRPRRARAFTLIEIMVAMAIAMTLAVVCITVFVQIRHLIRRAEARMELYETAQAIYARLNLSLSQLMQSCAFVAQSDANGVTLVFMRGKEDAGNWDMWQRTLFNSDLVWEEWKWSITSTSPVIGTLAVGSSTPLRAFSASLPGYKTQYYQALPQPLRSLDAANPITSTTAGLGATNYYHSSTVAGDFSDATDLANNLAPVLKNVSNLTLQFVTQDGSVDTVSTATPVTYVQQGVWLDGRVGDAVDGNGGPPTALAATAAAYPSSEIAKRPKLLRVSFTVTDTAVDPMAPLVQTFAFSFALPGLAGNQ